MLKLVDKKGKHNSSHFLGSGWAFPVAFAAGNHQLNTTQHEQNIEQNIHIIVHTRLGERTMRPFFGGGLEKYMFKALNENLKGALISSIQKALLDHEPRITTETIDVEFIDMVGGVVQVHIEYIFNKTNTRHNYVFPYSLIEGTNL